MKRTWLTCAAFAVLLLVACAPGANPMVHQSPDGAPPAGFLLGLWHGIIIWITFFWSLFDHSVSVYEVHNSGWAYNLGFVIGAATLHGGASKTHKIVIRRERRV